MWGQDGVFLPALRLVRIIPTRVGTSPILIDADFSVEDHPHACGDKKIKAPSESGLVGSSPRVWGQGRL